MSGTTASSSVAVGIGGEVGYGGYRAPFTAVQWQELEHQAMIYKYLVAGLPVPPDLVLLIRHSFDALSARFFHHPSLGYCSYYGKKFDPEPGRCRRTDGKKWRCSKDAHPDSKYCERHMHRGRNRSRKPVESQSTSQSVSTAIPHISSGRGNNTGSFRGSGCGSFQNVPFYSVVSSEASSFGSNATKLQIEPLSYGIDNKDLRYIHGVTPDTDDHSFSFSPEGSASVGLRSSTGGGTWRLTPSQVCSSSILKLKTDSQFLGPSSSQQSTIPHTFESNDKQQQHCFLGTAKEQQQQPIHPFFSEWPMTKESWSSLDDDEDGSNKNFSSTQLSISIPRASANFSSSGYSTQDT